VFPSRMVLRDSLQRTKAAHLRDSLARIVLPMVRRRARAVGATLFRPKGLCKNQNRIRTFLKASRRGLQGQSMNDYQNLDTFNLAHHGDARERQWAARVLPVFPAYEVFWRRYIVPLTNRVTPNVSQSDENWIRPRTEAPTRLEPMTMSHYSVFYYFARAITQTETQNQENPEDTFALLTACGENVLRFSSAVSAILNDFGRDTKFLPSQIKELCLPADPRGCFVEVNDYRNTFLHYPVLGRRVGLDRQYLPKREYLDRVCSSWREAERLRPDDLIESEELISRLRRETSAFLQGTWEQLISRLDAVRNTERFAKQWALQEMTSIPVPSHTISISRQVSSSATGVVMPFIDGRKQD